MGDDFPFQSRAMAGACALATLYRTLRRLESTGLRESFAFECRKRGIERELGAEIQGHTLYFTGTCADCRSSP